MPAWSRRAYRSSTSAELSNPRAIRPTARPADNRILPALATVSVIWGTTFLAVRVMVETMPPLLGGALRFLAAGVVLLAALAIRRGGVATVVAIGRPAHAAAAAIGLSLVGAFCLVGLAFGQHTTSGLAALLYASVPLWVVVFRITIDRQRVARATLVSVMIGFAGVAFLLAPRHGASAGSVLGVLLVLGAAALWAAGSFAATRVPLPQDVMVSAGWQMVWGSMFALVAGTVAGEHLAVTEFSLRSWLALLYLLCLSSAIAFTIYTWLVQRAPVSHTATWAYISPVIAVAAGWAVLGEPVAASTIAGAALIAVSVAATIRSEARAVTRG
jgi:drug/metabolite transporter (DMT)-like permease